MISTESIQVLRGPQGTLFGKNTAAGALLVTSVKPHEEMAGEVSVDVGNPDRFNVAGNLNIPLTDTLFARFTVDSRERDGYMDDVSSGVDYGDVEKIAYAAQVRWLASDAITVDALAFYSEQDENSAPQTGQIARLGTAPQGLLAPGDSRTYPQACQDSADLENDDKVELDRTGVPWQMESTMRGLTIDWELDNFSVKSITAYLSQENIANYRDPAVTALFGKPGPGHRANGVQWN